MSGSQDPINSVPTSLQTSTKEKKYSSIAVLASLIVPFALWPIIFGPLSGSFWFGLASATAVLMLLSFAINRGLRLGVSWSWLFFGAVSGVLLYGCFYIGFQLTRGIPAFSGGVSSVYLLRGNVSPLLVAALLIFPIGPGEEIYWRGLIQRFLDTKLAKNYSWIVQVAPYTLVHLFTLNPPLLVTALIGGLAWGFLYRVSGSITPAILSHIIFDMLIFVVLPFG